MKPRTGRKAHSWWWAPGLALLLPLGLAAQGRGGFGGRRGPPAPDADTRAMVQALVNTARAGVAALPVLAAPIATADLARDEDRLFPEQATADYTAAFQLARALVPPAASDPSYAAVMAIKARVERDAVAAIARQRPPAGVPATAPDAPFNAALQLARRADVPRAALYDPLITLALQRGASADDVIALTLECARGDGTYPYRGLATALRGGRFGGGGRGEDDRGDRQLLANAGLRYLAHDANTAEYTDALFFVQNARRAFPAMQPQLDAVLNGMLALLTASDSTNTTLWSRVQAMLQDDSSAAAPAAGNFGAVSANAGGGGRGGRGRQGGGAAATGNGQATFSFSTTAVAPVLPDSGESVGTGQFVLLVHRAQVLARSSPVAALAAAHQASAMLNNATLSAALDEAATLASTYSELGASLDAARVLAQCLDAADRLGVAADQNAATGDPATRAALIERLDGDAAPVIDVYSVAARLDPGATALRAESSPMVLFKPLVLSRLAMLAQSPPRPLPVRRVAVLP